MLRLRHWVARRASRFFEKTLVACNKNIVQLKIIPNHLAILQNITIIFLRRSRYMELLYEIVDRHNTA